MALSKLKNIFAEHKGSIISGLTSATVATGLHLLFKKQMEDKYSRPPKVIVVSSDKKMLDKLLKGKQ